MGFATEQVYLSLSPSVSLSQSFSNNNFSENLFSMFDFFSSFSSFSLTFAENFMGQIFIDLLSKKKTETKNIPTVMLKQLKTQIKQK